MKRFTPKKSFFSITPRLFTACGFLALLAASTSAMDRLVPAAFPTIQAAVNAALPGDRIVVAPGVYQEHVVSTNSDLKFIGKNTVWDGTLTNGTAGVCLTSTGDNMLVQGFIFRAGQSGAAQVQITGTNARVARCSSRGPSARFLKITGDTALVDACSLYAVNSTAIEINGDGAIVRKLKTRQCDDAVVLINGDGANVTGCNMALNDDGASIDINGDRATVSLNTFVNCDSAISISGTNGIVTKNKAVNIDTFVTVDGANATVTVNRVSNCQGTFLSVNSDNARVEQNGGVATGSIRITGDNVTVRGNTSSDASNDRTGLTVNSRTGAGGGLVEKNTVKDAASTGLSLGCNNAIILGNRVTGAGTESSESACRISGSGNLLTNNVVIGGGTHGFDVTGVNNTLVKCVAIGAAADGFHITGNGTSLLLCDAMLCTGEGLDNGGANTTVLDCAFQKNRLDVANDGTFSNLGTFAVANTFVTGGPAQLPQVD